MGKYYYKKNNRNKLRKYLRFISVACIIIGASIIAYILLPIISWQIYFQPSISPQNITLSIPRSDIINLTKNSLDRTDYTKAENWFPRFNPKSSEKTDAVYAISIPKINIKEAVVSTVDTNLAKHLVNYPGTGIPRKN